MSQIMYAGSKRKATAMERMRSKRAKTSTSKRRGFSLTKYIGAGRIIPDKLVTTIRYHESVLTSSVGATDYQFNLNSIFDPNKTGTGHQPLGHDQLATLYQRYRVTKCAWDVKFTSVTAAAIIDFCVVPSNSGSSLTDYTAFEQPYSQVALSGGLGTVSGVWQHRRIKGSTFLSKVYGINRSTMEGSDRYQAAFGASPSETAVLHCVGVEYAANNMQFVVTADLVYTVECFDRAQLAGS